jgi:PPOX class probable F420-dependent enzyme
MASLSDALVQELLEGRYIASLATKNTDGSIHLVAVWYLFAGGRIYIATAARSRKTRNLETDAKVTIMIDSRDVAASRGAQIACTAKIVTGEASRQWNARLHRKYLSEPALADSKVGAMFATMDDVTIELAPGSVVSWDMRQLDRQLLGGAIEKNPSYLLPLER